MTSGDLSVLADATGSMLAADADPLLASKFAVPPAPPFTVVRERLLDRLTHAVRNPLTAVTGPPGSGKTQMAASWVSAGRAPGPVVWITLEDGDDEPGIFWPYLVEGLRRSGITLSTTIEAVVRDGAVARFPLPRLAADVAAHPVPVILVLDTVSVLSHRELAVDLDLLLRYTNHRLRIILVGRWDPPFPLYRYRLAGTLDEIQGKDLAFTATEAAALLDGHGVELPDRALKLLIERTEGWAAGLRLFAMALEGHGDAEDLIVTMAGDETNIAEYFLGEVLSAQPSQVRNFLLRTSVVDAFTPELAEALTGQGGARQILAGLERANAFVQRIAPRSTMHRYHRLFAELLRAQLAYEEPAEVPRLHRAASAWFIANGRPAEAIRHAAQAQDWSHACALVIDDLGIGHLVANGNADRLGGLFRDMPTNVDDPEAALVAAALCLANADPGEAEKHLARARYSADLSSSVRTVHFRLAAALLEAVEATMHSDAPRALDAVDMAEALLAQVPPERITARPELRAILLYCRGSALSWVGALDDAVVVLTEGVRTASAPGCDRMRLACLQKLALVNAYRGRLHEAADLAGQAVELHDLESATSPHAAMAALAWVACERWEMDSAWRHLRAAETSVSTCEEPIATVAVALVRARLLAGRGEIRAAARALSEVQKTWADRVPPSWLEQAITLSLARLAVTAGTPEEALAAIDTLADPTSAPAVLVAAAAHMARGDTHRAGELVAPVLDASELPTPLLIEARLVLTIAAIERGEANAARDCLLQALALATGDGHRRPFHEAGPRLRQLLRNDVDLAARYRSIGASPVPRPHRQPGGESQLDTPVVLGELSARELQVLRYLAAMLGTVEIAEAMYLSVNTVKTHVRSILRKLAASRRNEAVRRARALGLV